MKKILLLVPLLMFLAACSKTEEDTTAPAPADTTATNAPAAPAAPAQ